MVDDCSEMKWTEFREQVRAIMRGKGDPDAVAAHDLIREVTDALHDAEAIGRLDEAEKLVGDGPPHIEADKVLLWLLEKLGHQEVADRYASLHISWYYS